jgi:hypothetical protein
MFWRKKWTEQKGKKKQAVKKIEGALWGYMVSQHGVIVDILQNLRRVEKDAVVGDKPVGLTMIRIFDPATADKQGVAIDDYDSLDDYPELILYEGYYREVSGQATDIHLEKK